MSTLSFEFQWRAYYSYLDSLLQTNNTKKTLKQLSPCRSVQQHKHISPQFLARCPAPAVSIPTGGQFFIPWSLHLTSYSHRYTLASSTAITFLILSIALPNHPNTIRLNTIGFFSTFLKTQISTSP